MFRSLSSEVRAEISNLVVLCLHVEYKKALLKCTIRDFPIHFSEFAIPAETTSLKKAHSILVERPKVKQNVEELPPVKQASFL